ATRKSETRNEAGRVCFPISCFGFRICLLGIWLRKESPVNADWRNRYEVAVALAQRAGQRALSYFAGNFQVELKEDQSPVTIADRESEQLLRSTLKAAFPKDGFLGEEYGDEPGTSGYRWIIDPIDGTRNFVRAIPIWATLVGL